MKITPELLQVIVTFIVGGGLATLVAQIVRGVGSFRSGARATTREVVKDLAAARDEAEDRLADMVRDKDYWRNTAGSYAFQLRSRGITPDPAEPMSPSERAREIGRRQDKPGRLGRVFRGQARADRAQAAPSTEELRQVLGDRDETGDDR